jgi:hypothetical protein
MSERKKNDVAALNKAELLDTDLEKVTGGDFSFQIFGYQIDFKQTTSVGGETGGPLVRVVHSTLTIGPAPKPA